MQFHYLISGSRGDIELTPSILAQPFLLSPTEKHPFLSLGDYFEAIRKMLRQDGCHALVNALSAVFSRQVKPADISQVVIRSEKHGAFYHIASIAVTVPAGTAILAVTTALSAQAKSCLAHEYHIIRDLAARVTPEFLPQLYSKNHLEYQSGTGKEEFLMVLGEWLDGYHEWHLSQDKKTAGPVILLWDNRNGYDFLSKPESVELIKQISGILTCYFDRLSFCQVYPWHHGAGDFVVCRKNSTIDVKLITVRNNSPLIDLPAEEESSQLVAVINFLMNLTVRIRLDKLDGIGAPAWMDDFAVEPCIKGFFGALGQTATRTSDIGSAELLEILQAFDPQEYLAMYQPLLEIYSQEDDADFALILEKLPGHVNRLHQVIQEFEL
jgi:hypothetical protein